MEDAPLAPIRVSWSSLRRWETCRHKFLRVSEGKSHGAQNARDFLVGNVADRVMRYMMQIDDPAKGQMERLVIPVFNQLTAPNHEKERVIRWKGDPTKDKQHVIDMATECVQKLEPIMFELIFPYEYQADLRFRTTTYIPAPDDSMIAIEMHGAIDAAVRRPESVYHLYDLKATENPSYIQETLGQSIFYDVAFGSWIGDMLQPERFAFIAPLLKEQVVWVDISDDDRRLMMTRIIEYAHGIWSGEYPPLAGESPRPCWNCEVKHACDRYAVPQRVGGRVSFADAARIRTLS